MKIRFNNASNKKFIEVLKTRLSAHFDKLPNNQHANTAMWVKVWFWLLSWLGTYLLLILAGKEMSGYQQLLVAVLHGFTHLFIAFNISHDANHYAISKSRTVNELYSLSLDLIGVNSYLWRVSHNEEHHTYINVLEVDNNINGFGVLRFSPQDRLLPFFKYQHLYAPLLYGLVTFNYATFKDFQLGWKAIKNGRKIPAMEIVKMLFFKMFYFLYVVIIPYMVLEIPLWKILLTFVFVHFLLGLTLSFVFQCGHLTEDAHYPEVDENGNINDAWAVHVVKTTCDFGSENPFLNWMVGSINIHVIHHIYPKICHIHYHDVYPIVKQTAEEFGLYYRQYPSFWSAIRSHIKILKELGRGNDDYIKQQLEMR
ncbi:MAG: fatty acid desaturase family protein [Bacteroidia bacterium]